MTFPTRRRLFFHYSKSPPMSRTGGKPTVRKRMRRNPPFSRSYPLGILSEMPSRNNIILGSYEEKYIQWTMMWQQRDKDVHELTNLFHTLCTKLGIKYSEKHLVLKYRNCLHRYIQEEMEFLNISSLGTTYGMLPRLRRNSNRRRETLDL
jgi:hypothetical protein